MPSFTITLDAAQTARIQAAFATPQNPSPGVAEIKEFCISRLRAYVHEVERRNATNAITVTALEPT